MNRQKSVKALERAKEILGSENAVAAALGYSQQAVNEVFREERPAPPKWCIPLEKATADKVRETGKGKPVTRYELRPDIYPPHEAAAVA